MRFIRFQYQRSVYWGVLEAEAARVLRLPPFAALKYSNVKFPLKKIKLLSPAVPSKIILVGLNYRDHAKELRMAVPKHPIVFLKPPTALIGPGGVIAYPSGVKRLDYEAELAVVIKKRAKNVSVKKAPDYILGYTCLNDVTARDLQEKDGQWTRAKSFDSFCPVGPWIETRLKTDELKISSYLNGKLKQHSNTAHFIFSISELVSFTSKIMTLLPGDIISTGTPPGVGPMRPGDSIDVSIEGIGTLCNRVASPKQ